jgi:hypothetical protein
MTEALLSNCSAAKVVALAHQTSSQCITSTQPDRKHKETADM